jgi:hypothetical protein
LLPENIVSIATDLYCTIKRIVYTKSRLLILKTVKMKKINTSTYLLLFWFHIFISCNQDSIDKVNSPIAYESIGFENSDDIAAANLITKFSFENSISDSKNGITGGVGGCSYAPGIKEEAYQGSSSSFIAYNNVANPLIAIKDYCFYVD